MCLRQLQYSHFEAMQHIILNVIQKIPEKLFLEHKNIIVI